MENFEGNNLSDDERVVMPRESVLSPEDLSRCDQDIKTMSALHELAGVHNAASVISGGYAVEAHCGGRITRPHRDMDVHWRGPDLLSGDSIEEVQAILQSDGKQWRTEEKKPNEKYQFDEVGEAGKKGRRLEWSIDRPTAKGHEIKFLLDSQGNKHEVAVPPLTDVVSGKIVIFDLKNSMSKEEKALDRRPTKVQDIRDFQRLLALPEFDQSACLQFLEGYAKHKRKQVGENISSDQAKILAQEEWDKTMDFVNGFESPR